MTNETKQPNHPRPLADRLADEAAVVAVTDPSRAVLLREAAAALDDAQQCRDGFWLCAHAEKLARERDELRAEMATLVKLAIPILHEHAAYLSDTGEHIADALLRVTNAKITNLRSKSPFVCEGCGEMQDRLVEKIIKSEVISCCPDCSTVSMHTRQLIRKVTCEIDELRAEVETYKNVIAAYVIQSSENNKSLRVGPAALAHARHDAYAGAMRDAAELRELCEAYRIVIEHLGYSSHEPHEATQ